MRATVRVTTDSLNHGECVHTTDAEPRVDEPPMPTYRRGGHVRDDDDGVERECELCNWHCVADSYPALVREYQMHLRSDHPKAWLRA